MNIKMINLIMRNLEILGIETLSIKELNRIGEFLQERNITNIEDAKSAVAQYVSSHK